MDFFDNHHQVVVSSFMPVIRVIIIEPIRRSVARTRRSRVFLRDVLFETTTNATTRTPGWAVEWCTMFELRR